MRAIPNVCEWADFPQYLKCMLIALIGRSDIALEMYESGELAEMLAEGDSE